MSALATHKRVAEVVEVVLSGNLGRQFSRQKRGVGGKI